MKRFNFLVFFLLLFAIIACKSKRETTEKYLRHFIEKHNEETERIYIKRNLAQWEALTSRNNEAMKKFEKMESNLLEKIVNRHETNSDIEFYNTFNSYLYTDYEDFEYLKKIKESGYVEDTLLKRQLELLYIEFLYAQVGLQLPKNPSEINEEIGKHFDSFKFKFDNDSMSIHDLFRVLRSSACEDSLKKAWMGISDAGKFSQQKILEMVRIRNAKALEFGFENYYDLNLSFYEQTTPTVLKYLDQIDFATRNIYNKFKKDVDDKLAKHFQIEPKDLMPWHYQNLSFNNMPNLLIENAPNAINEKTDFASSTKRFLRIFDLSSDDIIDNSYINLSDTNRNIFSFSLDVDNKGDSRFAVSTKPNFRGIRNLFHNLGHSVYEKFIPNTIPNQLREPNLGMHEAIAGVFENLIFDSTILTQLEIMNSENSDWFSNLSEQYFIRRLLFSRYLQVLVRFEIELYYNPGQDLDKRWWELTRKYMFINPPPKSCNSRWGYSNYVFGYDCYLQHYAIGMLSSSQLKHDAYKKYLSNVNGDEDFNNFFGDYLKNIFNYGNSVPWQELIKKVTNQELNAKSYHSDIESQYNKHIKNK